MGGAVNTEDSLNRGHSEQGRQIIRPIHSEDGNLLQSVKTLRPPCCKQRWRRSYNSRASTWAICMHQEAWIRARGKSSRTTREGSSHQGRQGESSKENTPSLRIPGLLFSHRRGCASPCRHRRLGCVVAMRACTQQHCRHHADVCKCCSLHCQRSPCLPRPPYSPPYSPCAGAVAAAAFGAAEAADWGAAAAAAAAFSAARFALNSAAAQRGSSCIVEKKGIF